MNRNRGIDFEPDANGAGRDGFRDGDPDAEPVITASEYSSEQANGIQEEIVRTIEKLGGTPDYGDNEQMSTRIIGTVDGTYPLLNPPTRVLMLGIEDSQGWGDEDGNPGDLWTHDSNDPASAVSTAAKALRMFSLTRKVPAGAVITRIRALVDPGAPHSSGSQKMSVTVVSIGATGTTLANTFQRGAYLTDNTDTLQWIDSGAITATVVDGEILRAFVRATTDASGDKAIALEITHTDPYPGRR